MRVSGTRPVLAVAIAHTLLVHIYMYVIIYVPGCCPHVPLGRHSRVVVATYTNYYNTRTSTVSQSVSQPVGQSVVRPV